MIQGLQITQLVENTAGGPDLLAEHGAALHIIADGRQLLFDTNQGLALRHNAARLGIDLGRIGRGGAARSSTWPARSTCIPVARQFSVFRAKNLLISLVFLETRTCPVYLHPASVRQRLSGGLPG